MPERWRLACAAAIMSLAAAGCSSGSHPGATNHSRDAAMAASAHPLKAARPPTAAATADPDQAEDVGVGTPGRQHFIADGPLVTDDGIPIFQETEAFHWTPAERARRIVARLNMIASTHDFDPISIFMKHVGGYPTVFYYHRHGPNSEGHIIATVDPQTAWQFGYGGHADLLAYWWRDLLRDHDLIIKGKAPRWTTRYAPTLQRLYEQLQQLRPGVPARATFDEALSRLSPLELQALKTLYTNVPVNYHPVHDSIAAAEASDIDDEPGRKVADRK